MLKSMTGYGKGEFLDEARHITLELKSINNRYCDIYVRYHKKYSFAEEHIKSYIKEYIKRGKIDVTLTIENLSKSDVTIALDKELAKDYIQAIDELALETGFQNDITLLDIANMPDVIKSIPKTEDEKEIIENIKTALKIAIEDFDNMRKIEGSNLENDIVERSNIILDDLDVIKEKAPMLPVIYKEKLEERIKQILDSNVDIADEKIATEVAFFADKSDITEEIIRLESHLKQLNNIIKIGGSVGKKLDFLVQEMNRETNTIGSKANDLDITMQVINIKSEIEKIREQIQNVE